MKRNRLWYSGILAVLVLAICSYAQLNNPFMSIFEKVKTKISSMWRYHHPHVQIQTVIRTVVVGDTAKFCVKTCGEHLRYQWFKDGDTLQGENKPYLIIPQTDFTDEGEYWCTFSSYREHCCPSNSDTVKLIVMPYKGFDPVSISGLHLWFRDDKGVLLYKNGIGVPVKNCGKDDDFCKNRSEQEWEKDDDDPPYERGGNHNDGMRNHDYEEGYDFDTERNGFDQGNGCSDNCPEHGLYDTYKSCFCGRDINVTPEEFTFMAVFNSRGKQCDIYQCRIFKIFCCDSVCFMGYENGRKDVLGKVTGYTNIAVIKSANSIVIRLNNETVKTITVSGFHHCFPFHNWKMLGHWFCIGSEPICRGIWQGSLNEFVFYRRALTSDECEQARTYLVSKYSEHLNDLWHSEWAYAPAFHPSIRSYKAVLPYFVDSLTIDAVKSSPDLTVTINGQNPPVKINLPGLQYTLTVNVETPMGPLAYQMNFEKLNYYAIYVKKSAVGANTGTSWYNAYTDLQAALDDAGRSGKEIWLAEGTYLPSKQTDPKDPRSATFLIVPGTEIIGGFKGDEADKRTIEFDPTTVYNFILSGDFAANDDDVSTWPPDSSLGTNDSVLLSDNAFHVITTFGCRDAVSINLEGVTITRGLANGNKGNGFGGGVYNPNCSPTISKCVISKNIAYSNGAGMYSGSAAKRIENCLFKSNYSKNGHGGGMYTRKGATEINASVFEGNIADGESLSNGGALYNYYMDMEMVNCVITQNSCRNDGGAIFNDSSSLRIINCTFFANSAALLGGGITNVRGTIDTIINTILWQNRGGTTACAATPGCFVDLSGNGFSVSYSCITGGYTGTGNISSDPQFVNSAHPSGTDGMWGTADDGLQLQYQSPCKNAALDSVAPSVDIREYPRPTFGQSDMGAYELYVAPSSVNFGHYMKDGFVLDNNYYIITNLTDEFLLNHAILNYKTAVLQIEVPYNDNTKNKTVVYGSIYCSDDAGNNISGTSFNIPFYRVPGTSSFRTKLISSGIATGKEIAITNVADIANKTFTHAYVLLGKPNCKVSVEVDHDQFK